MKEPQDSVINDSFEKKSSTDPVWQKLAADLNPTDNAELLYYLYEGVLFAKKDNLMVRCRMSGGELSSAQLYGLADISKKYGGGYADVTTRANFQIREISFDNGLAVLRALLALDIFPSVKGLNNLRNVTVTPTSGFDELEHVDLRPMADALTKAMLFDSSLQGLPGKFNIGLDTGGRINVASEANDIGVRAVEEFGEVRYRLSLANLKQETTVSEDSGWLLTYDQILPVVSSVIAIFLEKGDFSKRLRSRLKYYVADVGLVQFKQEVIEKLGFELQEEALKSIRTAWPSEVAHSGVWNQLQTGKSYIGVHGDTGRFNVKQLEEIADIALKYGNDRVCLTTQQTCLIPDMLDTDIDEVLKRLLSVEVNLGGRFRGSIVACTGNQGCSYSATDTKRHAKQLQALLDDSLSGVEGMNIHFTGCPFSCAQSYIGDIGLLGAKIKGKECYHVFLGGGAKLNASATKVRHGMTVSELFSYLVSVIKKFMDSKECGESFFSYVNRVGSENAALGVEVSHV